VHKRSKSLRKEMFRLVPLLLVSGCARSPSFNVLGSYFPGWIICMVAGVLVASLLHVLIKRTGLEHRIPALPLFYSSLTLFIACTLWLITFE
jgi:hypothetical protein